MTLEACASEAAAGRGAGPGQMEELMYHPDEAELARAAGRVTRAVWGSGVDVEQLHNIKKNACSEDCTFCAQSALYDTGTETYRLPPADRIVDAARRAKEQGAGSYCLVAAWRRPPPGELEKVCGVARRIRSEVGIEVECSLGFLDGAEARALKSAGVKRYNHNLETARSKFAEICTTHSYQDRIDTLLAARGAGLELCTGGIIGLGETRRQRLELAVEIAALEPEEVTVNMLVPVPGTPLEMQPPLPPGEALRVFAVLRLALPRSIIKISGGRETATGDSGRALLEAGANGIITSGYLTMGGNEASQDMEMLEQMGRTPGAGRA